MPNKPQLLIIGPAAPSRSPAAGISTQAALYFKAQATVTVVISDYAPPTHDFPSDITIIRERDLRENSKAYRSAKRLYIFDDSYESLFALRLFREAPAPWINADTTLHNLIHADYRAQPGYPDSYLAHMEAAMGTAGWHIGHSLSGEMRVSKVIASELPSFERLLKTNSGQQRDNRNLDLPFVTVPPEASATTLSTKDYFTVATIGDGTAQAAVETLKALGQSIECIALTGSEPDLTAQIASADTVCFLSKEDRLPPAGLAISLILGKVTITASQPWGRHLPDGTHLNVPHSQASRYLVAALGSVLTQSSIRQWLEKNAKDFVLSLNLAENHKNSAHAILTAETEPLDLKATSNKKETRRPEKPVAPKKTSSGLPNKGPKLPYALIGAVPAQTLVSQVFPGIDWDNSPKFATPELAAVLTRATGKAPPTILALLGYESLLVNTSSTAEPYTAMPHMPEAHDWTHIQPKLKKIDQAISFDCDVSGVPRVPALTSANTVAPGGLTLDFSSAVHTDPKRQVTSGFLNTSGTYWQLNKTEHRIDCLLISGIPGDYKLSVGPESDEPTQTAVFMITTDLSSNLMTPNNPAAVTTDPQGVIQFSISAVHPTGHFPVGYEKLLKTLASTPLYLEWCTHG